MADQRNAVPEARCAALKSKGGRCKNVALAGRLFCRYHDPDVPTATGTKWAGTEAIRKTAEFQMLRERISKGRE